MKTIKVSDLSGVELDYWVARAAGLENPRIELGHVEFTATVEGTKWAEAFSPSTNWNDCGPLIEEGGIEIWKVWKDGAVLPMASVPNRSSILSNGWMKFLSKKVGIKTAICRAFIASKKGEEFEVVEDVK